MASDGSIKISIDVDGKQVSVASKELDKLEDSGHKSGKGIKAAENSMDSLGDSSSSTSKSVKGASDSLDDLGDSGSKAGKGVKGAESSVDSLADSSSSASSSVKGAADSLDNLGDSGSSAGKDLKGADSAIDGLSDSSAEASKGVKGTADSLDGMSDSASEAASAAKKAGDETAGAGDKADKSSGNVKKFAASLGLIAIASAAFVTLKSSMDDAITRFDTLNTFPKVLQALGVSAEESERAMTNLSEGIDGLPTTLNDIASNAQRMYTSFGDMDKATDSALALNNALLGSGASTAQASRGTEQYLKSLQTGKMYLSTWNTLSETMDVGLIKIAEGFGYAGKSAKDDLYNALQDGTVSMDAFNDKLIEVGTGTGIMAKLAKENSLGLATSIGNLKNAAARGIADIIDSFDKLAKNVTGKNIAENIDSLKHVVNASFKAIGSVIEGTTPVIIAFASGVKATMPVVQALTPAIIGLVAAYAAYTVITKASAAIETSNAVLKTAMGLNKALTLVTHAQITAQMLSTGATKADIAAKLAQTATVKISTVVIGLMTGTITLSRAAQILATAATYAWAAAIKFLSGPVGWVTAGIALLVTGVIAVVKWFKKSSEESKQLAEDTEKLGDSTDALNESVASSSEAYKEQQKDAENTSKVNAELAKSVEDLAEKENKSAGEKLILAENIEKLNSEVEGLNLTYNEEANALSLSSEELNERVGIMGEMESLTAGQERLLEISKEQMEVDAKLGEINELRADAKEKMENLDIKSKDYADTLADLQEQEDGLKVTEGELSEQYKATEQQVTESSEKVAASTSASVDSQLEAYAKLDEGTKELVDGMMSTWETYKEAATDMFDTLTDKAEISVGQMTDNLEENQRIIGEWAENIATLAERGVDEGLLETLREAGPESAGHVNELVNASDAELEKLSGLFAEGGQVATDALGKSLGIENSGIPEAVSNLATGMEKSLKDEIAATDFESIGLAIPDGAAAGVDKGAKKVADAAKNMADDTTKAAKGALDINSPSGVFEKVGKSIPEGAALGINNGTSMVTKAVKKMFKAIETDSVSSFKNITKSYDNAVKDIEKSLSKLPEVTQKAMKNTLDRLKSSATMQITAMKTLAKDYDREIKNIDKSLNKLPGITQKSMSNMLTRLKSGATSQVNVMRSLSRNLITPFNRTPSQLNSVGKNAMSGLNAGLNAGRGRVMSTARGIANSVASTMRKALDIHSPSRVMRDGVGLEAVAGVAVGIDENAGMVYKALDRLSSGIISFSTPEVALGTHSMARNAMPMSAVRSTSTNDSNSRNDQQLKSQSKEEPANITLVLGGREYDAFVGDITGTQERVELRLKSFRG